MRQPASGAILWETNADAIDLVETLSWGIHGNRDISEIGLGSHTKLQIWLELEHVDKLLAYSCKTDEIYIRHVVVPLEDR